MSVPRYPNETAPVSIGTDAPWVSALPDELANIMAGSAAETACSTCGGAGEIDESLGGHSRAGIVACPDCAAVTPEPAPDPNAKLYEANERKLEQYRAEADDDLSSYDKLRGAVSQADIVPEAQDAINEMVENGWLPEALMRHLRLLGPELELWSPKPGFPRHSGLFMLSAATALENQGRLIADLEAKLDAERTLRAQGAADLERENAHERDRRIGAESRARDALWALDAAIEALVPLAGYATEEDGRVAGMTNPVCLAMSSVRRADALVKLHRALRR